MDDENEGIESNTEPEKESGTGETETEEPEVVPEFSFHGLPSFYYGTNAQMVNQDYVDGSFHVAVDEPQFYVDLNNTRILLNDGVILDSELSDESIHPVENHVIKTVTDGKSDIIKYNTTVSHSSGYYKISFLPETSWMLSFILVLYQGYKSYVVNISGYNYGTNHWYQPQATLLGSTGQSLDVTFGYDGDYQLWIAIPAADYTGLTLSNISNGYRYIDNWFDKISIEYVSELPTTVQSTMTATGVVAVQSTEPNDPACKIWIKTS